MANIKSAKKKIKVSYRNQQRRKKVVVAVKAAFKVAERAITKKASEAADLVKKACKAIDKATSNKIYHKNTAARHKSRLVKKLNKIKA
ncbi:MAG: 30S ribosomal protein S20 [Candidatus Margulisbacteria bacterium]|nr:30S ribosomal protein S20 [Candidatus Margulisiibacteriota bacterium]MBU1021170.1 30S ribosomal protein S20 [Candidatus Margulisiibacteriota bacterium]MBU1729776.1 30S ribosomal protein S20 [Candidatus Margulisiibacteriota bacterium]MBU1955277.1 30S ribosomal protein S20 [Candidatus Margulisiibacteriota bacterium]